jgi:hypothetical protein
MKLRILMFSAALALPVIGCGGSEETPGGGGASGGRTGSGGAAGRGGSGGSAAGGSGGSQSAGGSGGGAGTGGSSDAGPDSSEGGSGDGGGDAGSDVGGSDASGDARETGGDGGTSALMSFFVTSRGMGKGGDFGGLAGADAHCLALAKAVGSTKAKWAAYLSSAGGGTPVHARNRIGAGPWFNAKGVMIATSVDNLHADSGRMNALNEANSLDETGAIVPGRTEANRPTGTMNEHDIVTGSTIDGMLSAGNTCDDWTSSAATGVRAQVGHSDKLGPQPGMREEWNAAHTSAGCAEGRSSMGGIGSGGGRGSFYCFATE